MSVYGLLRWTNNKIESFHNDLKLKFAVSHPSLWVFLGKQTILIVNFNINVLLSIYFFFKYEHNHAIKY